MASNGRRKGPALPQLQPASASFSNDSATSGGTAPPKCRGEFCRVAPSALRGLYGARANNAEDGSDNDNIDSDDGNDGDATLRRRALRREYDAVLDDDGRRFKIGNNNLLLAKAEMAFVTGAVASSDDVALQWQEADNVYRMELGRANPTAFYKQVSVCRNCHRIYSDLASFRDNGFQWHAPHKSVSHAVAKDRGVTKTKKTGALGGRERPQVGGGTVVRKDTFSSPEDDATLQYDRLFLEELAKHSDADELRSWRQQPSGSARSEREAEPESRSLSLVRASANALPALSSTPSNVSAPSKKKKLGNSPGNAPSKEDHSSNQQFGNLTSGRGTSPDSPANVASGLELVIKQLREQLAHEQATVKRVESQRQLLEQKLIQNQTIIQEKEDEFRKKLLEFELESMNKKIRPDNSQISSGSQSSSASEVGQLIETIDSLNLQLHEANNAAEKLRRDLMLSHQQDTKRLHEKYQLEMETLRLSEYTAKEQTEAAHMQMNHWQNEAQVALSQAKSARAALDEMTKSRLPQLEEKNQRLERQILELRSKSSMTSAPNGPIQDVAAVEKHLNNKIDYLKAQLASEMKCKEELGSHLAGITASMEALKKEKRTALADQEEAHKRHLERLESNFSQEKEAMSKQIASLQGKVTTLQANVTDLVQELTMAKSRETNGKLAMDKMAEENVRLTRQIVDLEGHIEVLQDERKRDGSMGVKNANEETQRMQMEALLRRLDNERQYLKNQVDNEAEQKVQCQRQVHSLEEELRELKVSTEEITKMAEQKVNSLQNDKAHLERQVRDDKTAFEESKLMLTRQLKDMQVKFLQIREQSLIDKDEVEKARIELSDARSQLIAAREEIVKEKEYAKAANDRMSKALTTIKSSLKAMEEEKNLRIQRLDEENTLYMQKLAKTQGELLVLETKWSEDKQAIRRNQALMRFVSLLSGRLESKHIAVKANSFWKLHALSAGTKLQETLKSAHCDELATRENELRQHFADKCDELTQSLHLERIEALKQVQALHEREKEELQQYYQQERSQLEEDLQHIHTRQMRELEEQYEQTLKSVDEQSAAALGALQRRCDELEQERNEARTAVTDLETRYEQYEASLEVQQHSAASQLLDNQRQWEQEKESIINEHARQIQLLQEQADRKLREQAESNGESLTQALHVAKVQYMKDLDTLRANMGRETSETIENLKKEHAIEVQDLKDRHAKEAEQEKQLLTESFQRELEQERSKHEKALKSALERVELKTQGHLESLQKDMNDRKANALLQCTAKWQKAMEDLQARFEVEKKVAYESGLQDRENEWQQAALQIKQKQKEELDSVQNEAVRAIQAAEERHRMLLQAQTTLIQKESEARKQAEIEVLRAEIIGSEKANSQRELVEALREQEVRIRAHYEEELRSLRDELTDDHNADMKQLQDKWMREKNELIEALNHEHENSTQELEAAWQVKLDRFREEKESEMSSRLVEQEKALVKQVESVRLDMQEAFAVELEARLKEQEERLLNEQEEAINQVQEDSEKLIEQVEVAMGELKKQKEALENELTRLRSALEEAEDAHYDVEENLKKQQKSVAFQLMVLIMHAKKTMVDTNEAHTKQLLELQGKHDHLDAMIHREKRQWECDLAQVRETWTSVQSRHADMMQTLTTYKRDELVAHRSASAVLSNEVSIVIKQMDEVTEMKVTLEKEIEQLQAEAHNVEASLRQLMLQNSSMSSSSLSGGGDGSLNMAVVAKKRRLNEEFEALLDQVERKKNEVRTIDKTLASLRQRREDKESELKVMERKLVEILVGQQKQMLALLTATREIALPAAIAATTVAS